MHGVSICNGACLNLCQVILVRRGVAIAAFTLLFDRRVQLTIAMAGIQLFNLLWHMNRWAVRPFPVCSWLCACFRAAAFWFA